MQLRQLGFEVGHSLLLLSFGKLLGLLHDFIEALENLGITKLQTARTFTS